MHTYIYFKNPRARTPFPIEFALRLREFKRQTMWFNISSIYIRLEIVNTN